MKELYKIFLKEKPTKIILLLLEASKPVNILEISRKVKSSYSHVIKIIDSLESFEIIVSNKSGRDRLIMLTKKGIELAKKIKEIVNYF